MKILSIADYVEPVLYDQIDHDRFAGIDLILSSGDLPPEYLSFLSSTFNVPLYYVRGNHDIRYDSKPPEGCVDLHANIVQFQNLNILGFEGSRWYNGGPNQYTDRHMQKTIRSMRFKIWKKGGVDMIITHAPPRYIHDAEDPCHKGFKSFRRLIDKYDPAYFIHGHIHQKFDDPSQRVTVLNNTKVINTYGHNVLEINTSQTAQNIPAS